jgi:PKD repeat protein
MRREGQTWLASLRARSRIPLHLGLALLGAHASTGAAQDIGFEGSRFTGAGPTPTESKPESKLWFHDGSWWGSLWSSAAQAFRIHRLELSTHAWTDVGVDLDPRPNSHSDVLWDGTRLYFATHEFSSTGGAAGNPIRVLRFSYFPASRTYGLDPGFPVTIGDFSTEALVIDKDSTGTVWAAWTQGLRVRISHTLGSDTTWSPSVVLPSNTTDLLVDDICSLVHFNGDRIGAAWSDQSSGVFRFSVHLDGAPDTAWSGPETANTGTDDHLRLATDGAGRVFMACKSVTDEVLLLVRDPAGWHRFVAWQPSPIHTRPILLLDEQDRTIHMFTTGQDSGEIFEKVSSLDALAFPEGEGRIVMRDGETPFRISNPTSTKQKVNASTGLVVLAHHDTTGFYWHHDVAPDPSGPPVADFVGSPTSGQAPLTVQFTDRSSGDVTSGVWNFGDGTTSTLRNPAHTYGPGTYTVSLNVSGPGGSDTETKPDYIVVTPSSGPPGADFIGSPTSGQAPLTVQFSDRSSGEVTSGLWSFGDGTTSSTERNPTHTYGPGTYTVSLTVSGPGGSDTETKPGYIVVTAPPPAADFTGSPTSGRAPLTVQFSDRSSGSIQSWSWSFGDGGTSSQRNPAHTYGPGTYTVHLTVTGPGGQDTATKTAYITATQAPPPPFLLPPVPGLAGVPSLITVTGASPGTLVALYRSRATGSSVVSTSGCSSVALALAQPSRIGVATANSLGVAVIAYTPPLSFLGQVHHFQAVDSGSCQASNLVTHHF